MSHTAAARSAGTGLGAYRYQRHQPEQALLYQIIEQHYPAFIAHLTDRGALLPEYVQQEFEDYLKCGRLEHGFLRVRCNTCHAEHLVAFRCKRRGFYPSCGARRMARKRGLIGRRGFARAAHVSMGAERALPVAVPVCQPSGDHGLDARHRLPCHRHASDQKEAFIPRIDAPMST